MTPHFSGSKLFLADNESDWIGFDTTIQRVTQIVDLEGKILGYGVIAASGAYVVMSPFDRDGVFVTKL